MPNTPASRDDSGTAGQSAGTPSSTRGLDEAELAEVDPVGAAEAEKRHEEIVRHAHDPNAFEPAEAEVQRAIEQDRAKKS